MLGGGSCEPPPSRFSLLRRLGRRANFSRTRLSGGPNRTPRSRSCGAVSLLGFRRQLLVCGLRRSWIRSPSAGESHPALRRGSERLPSGQAPRGSSLILMTSLDHLLPRVRSVYSAPVEELSLWASTSRLSRVCAGGPAGRRVRRRPRRSPRSTTGPARDSKGSSREVRSARGGESQEEGGRPAAGDT